MTTSHSIEARGLLVDYSTTWGTVRALECDDLNAPSGTSLAVMGPSGCGKSTLLGLLAGLAIPTRGTVTIGGEAITAMPQHERVAFRQQTIGMVYQTDNLLPFLTVVENVALPLSISRNGGAARTPWCDPFELLERLGLADLTHRLPDQLSGGERQRAAVARAVIHRPAVILADEPTGSLDGRAAQTVVALLCDVQRQLAATMVIVTHDPTVAASMDSTFHLDRPGLEVANAR